MILDSKPVVYLGGWGWYTTRLIFWDFKLYEEFIDFTRSPFFNKPYQIIVPIIE